MTLNLDKCETITFSRKQPNNILAHNYKIDDSEIKRVTVVKDLGLLLDNRLTFNTHVDQIVSRGKAVLGFI